MAAIVRWALMIRFGKPPFGRPSWQLAGRGETFHARLSSAAL